MPTPDFYPSLKNHSIDSMKYMVEMTKRIQNDIIKAPALLTKPKTMIIPTIKNRDDWIYRSYFKIGDLTINKAGVDGAKAGKKLKETISVLKWKEEDEVKELKGHRNWEFEVPHKNVVCQEEVTKYVTRENPLAFVTSSVTKYYDKEVKCKKGETKIVQCKKNVEVSCIAYVHSSIMQKAIIIVMYRNELTFQALDNPTVFKMSRNVDVKKVTQWVKDVKNAEWGDKAKREHVRVVVPKI